MCNDKFKTRLIIVGSLFLCVGLFLLLSMHGLLPRSFIIWPVLLFFVGLGFLLKRHFCQSRDFDIFFGSFFVMSSVIIILLYLGVLEGGLRSNWPMFLGISGIALIPYALLKKKSAKIGIIIPSGVMIIMSFFFLLFSKDIISLGFTEFVLSWWPLLFVFAGLVMIFTYFGLGEQKKTNHKSGKK